MKIVEKIVREILLSPLSLYLWWVNSALRRAPDEEAAQIAGRRMRPLYRLNGKRIQANMRRFFAPLGWDERAIAELRGKHTAWLAGLQVDIVRLGAPGAPEFFKERIRVLGAGHLDGALAKGRGVLLLSSHFGNWWHLRARICAWGRPAGNVANRMPLAVFETPLRALRKKYAIETVHIGGGGKRLANEIFARNGIFWTNYDIAVPGRENDSAWVKFGETEVYVDLGPARFAIDSGVPALRVSITRDGEGGRVVTLEPVETGDIDAVRLTERLLGRLREDVLAAPEEWWSWGFVGMRG